MNTRYEPNKRLLHRNKGLGTKPDRKKFDLVVTVVLIAWICVVAAIILTKWG